MNEGTCGCPVCATYPPEVVQTVALQAAEDADRVVLFLKQLGIEGSPERPVCLPANFFIRLADALRFLIWEEQGFLFHREAGLPSAMEAIKNALGLLKCPDDFADGPDTSVVTLSINRFAWQGRDDLGAEVALDDIHEDEALDAITEYLWATREMNRGTTGK